MSRGEKSKDLYAELSDCVGVKGLLAEKDSFIKDKRVELNKFIGSHVPPSDCKEIDRELKKTFALKKVKGSRKKKISKSTQNQQPKEQRHLEQQV